MTFNINIYPATLLNIPNFHQNSEATKLFAHHFKRGNLVKAHLTRSIVPFTIQHQAGRGSDTLPGTTTTKIRRTAATTIRDRAQGKSETRGTEITEDDDDDGPPKSQIA